MAELECERLVIGEASRAPRLWGIKPPDRVESGLLCQFPGSKSERLCGPSGSWQVLHNTPAGC